MMLIDLPAHLSNSSFIFLYVFVFAYFLIFCVAAFGSQNSLYAIWILQASYRFSRLDPQLKILEILCFTSTGKCSSIVQRSCDYGGQSKTLFGSCLTALQLFLTCVLDHCMSERVSPKTVTFLLKSWSKIETYCYTFKCSSTFITFPTSSAVKQAKIIRLPLTNVTKV